MNEQQRRNKKKFKKLYVPKDPLLWEARKVYNAVMIMDDRIAKGEAINWKEYRVIVGEFAKLVSKIQRQKGDTQRMATERVRRGTGAVGNEAPFGLDT